MSRFNQDNFNKKKKKKNLKVGGFLNFKFFGYWEFYFFFQNNFWKLK